MALCRGAVDVLMVSNTAGGLAGGGLGRLGNGQGSRQQAAPTDSHQVSEGDDLLRDKKLRFSRVKPVLLKGGPCDILRQPAISPTAPTRPQGEPAQQAANCPANSISISSFPLRISHFFCLFYFIKIKL